MTVQNARMNRQVLDVTTFDEQEPDYVYWLARTPAQRLAALELLRQMHYGYDPVDVRLRRIVEVVDAK